MKKLIKLSFMLVAVSVVASSCNCYKKMAKGFDDVTVVSTPEVMTLNNGKVDVEVSIDIPAKFFNKKAIIKATPVIIYKGGEVAAEPVMLQGTSVKENYKVVDFENGGTINENVSFDYIPAMRRSELQIRLEIACKCDDCDTYVLIDKNTMSAITKDQQEIIAADPQSEEAQSIIRGAGFKVADGVNTLQAEMKYDVMMDPMKDNYKRVTTTVNSADLVYSINSSYVNSKALKSDDISAFEDLVANNTKNDRMTQTLYANGYASPDGKETFNEELSEARSESGKEAMAKIFAEYGFDVDAAAYGEDWAGFKKLVEESNIEDKNLILQVLSMYDSATQREAEIKNLSAVFAELKSEVLPQLRRTQMNSRVDLEGKTDAEMLALVASKNYTALDLEETLYICNSLDVTNAEKIALLEYASKEFNDARAYNNLGVAYGAIGETAKAEKAFASALKNGAKGAEITNNMAMLNLENSKVATAKDFAQNSKSQGAVAAAEGDYSKAVKSMDGYNAAIAYTQMGNYTAAKNALSGDKSADGEYLRAVIASMEGDVKASRTSLLSAVKQDKSLKAKAESDVNLANLFESGFKF